MYIVMGKDWKQPKRPIRERQELKQAYTVEYHAVTGSKRKVS